MLLYLLIYCLVQQSRVHDIKELLDIWDGLQRSAIPGRCTIDGERLRACVRAKVGHSEL